MPFGVSNGGATYQRLMDMCLSGLPPDLIVAYLDDAVIFSTTFEQHMADLRLVLERFRTAKITLRPDKCTFGCTEINFLGYNLSERGIKPGKTLTGAILNFNPPTTKKEVKRFLGMVGFYRNFIEHFAHISQPLRELTKDDSNFYWTADCEKLFTKLKEPFSKEPILAFPVTNKEFIIEVDASNYSIGGILAQEQADGTIRPVAYYSCALSKQQQK